MKSKRELRRQQDRHQRTEELKAALASNDAKIEQIPASGTVAPPECWLMGY